MTFKTISTLTFYSPINKENSFGGWNIAERAKSTMELSISDVDGMRGCIEWDIDTGDGAEIGLWFEHDKKTLCDYDGVFQIPKQAIQLLELNGFNADYAKEE